MVARIGWQRVAACLSDADRRSLYAKVVIASDAGRNLSRNSLSRKDGRSLRALLESGLVLVDEENSLTPDGAAFSRLLELEKKGSEGFERFLEGGRLERSPSKIDDLKGVLGLIASQVLSPGEEVNERALMDRLIPLVHDPVGRRREMIEFGLIQRKRDGSSYWRSSHP